MTGMVRKLSTHPSIILGGMMVLGMLEFVALQRSQRQARHSKQAQEALYS